MVNRTHITRRTPAGAGNGFLLAVASRVLAVPGS
jgi:hypothetical protein